MSSTVALDSLQRRIRAMQELWRQGLSDLSSEQANHVERAGVLPIAFTLFHLVRMQDETVNVKLGAGDEIWTVEWRRRCGVTIDDEGRTRTVHEMMAQRITSMDDFRSYAAEVFQRTEEWLDGLTAERLNDVLLPRIPPDLRRTYSALVVGDGPVTTLDGAECWIYQHGIRHLGELEHARALVGLGGLTS